MIAGMLVPLWVLLAMLGTNLGLSPEHIGDKSVYISADSHLPLTGMACEG